MYSEYLCETMPLLISGDASWIKEHNQKQLERSASYYERHGDTKRAEEMNKYF